MKIAVFASEAGEKALHLHDFFKEGNRVSLELLYTDNPSAPVIEKMKAEGIEVIVLTPASDGAQIAETLRGRDVEMLVIDDFKGEIPPEVREAYGAAIVEPSSPENAPLELITTIDRIHSSQRNRIAEHQKPAPATADADTPQENKPSESEQEWAEVLEIDMEPDNKVSEPQEETPVQETEERINPPQYPTPGMPPYGYPEQAHMHADREPMPDTYLIWSVIITVLCCFIPGIVAIVYSSSVSSRYYRGDIEGAKRASRNAQIWCIVSIVAGIIWGTLYLPLSLLGF